MSSAIVGCIFHERKWRKNEDKKNALTNIWTALNHLNDYKNIDVICPANSTLR